MRFAAVLSLVAAATLVSAESNAFRFARGLPPKAPSKRSPTPAHMAARGQSSSTPGQCNTGSNNCCESMSTSGNGDSVDELLGLLGVSGLASGTSLGLNCNGVADFQSCTQQPVCCNGNSFSGLIVIGCSPINIG